MKERIKVTDIIDFQRDENDANRYYFGFWTDFDYWEIAFTLKDGEISDILLYNEEDYNRRYHVEESFAIDGKAKTLATKNREYLVEFTDNFFKKLAAELAELAELDRIEENTYRFFSLPALVKALENKEEDKYYRAEIVEQVIVTFNENRLRQAVSENMIEEIVGSIDSEAGTFKIQKDESGCYIFFTNYILNVYVEKDKAEVMPLIDYAFGPIDFPRHSFDYATSADLDDKIRSMIAATINKYEQLVFEDILYCDSLNDEEDFFFDDDEEDFDFDNI